MFCSNCGTPIYDGAKFCTACGAPVASVTVQPQTQVINADRVQPGPVVTSAAPKLPTNFALGKMFWLGILTFGIYPVVMMIKMSSYINRIARPYDGIRTMSYALIYFVFSWLTFGVLPIVWMHKFCGRIGRELRRRGIQYGFGARTFWIWGVVGSLYVVGGFIFIHKLCTAMNCLCADYNAKGV